MFSWVLATVAILLLLGLSACAHKITKGDDMNSGKTEEATKSTALGKMVEETRPVESKMRTKNERTIALAAPDDMHAVIVRVNTENYIPEDVKPTVVVNPYMFTARLSTEELSRLESDENVSAIEVSTKLEE